MRSVVILHDKLINQLDLQNDLFKILINLYSLDEDIAKYICVKLSKGNRMAICEHEVVSSGRMVKR